MERLIGLTLLSIKQTEDEMTLKTVCGRTFEMSHYQDCCEDVVVDDICGNLDNLLGYPIIVAEERVQDDPDALESGTFTFYELATNRGSVTIRWYGTSNGYYSESVDFFEKTGR